MRTVLALPLTCWLLVTGSVALAQEGPGKTTQTTVAQKPPTPPEEEEEEEATFQVTDGGSVIREDLTVTERSRTEGSQGNGAGGKPPASKPKPRPIYWYLDERPDGECRYASTVAYENFALGVLLTYAGGTQFRTLADFINYVNSLPVCPSTQEVPSDFHLRVRKAWDELVLDGPNVSFYPPEHGITGMEAYVGDAGTPRDKAIAIRIDSYVLSIEVEMTQIRVDWGDGSRPTFYDPDYFLPYPDAVLSHIYETKTCPPDYRANHPRGKLCHGTLEAYPVTVTYDWAARYTWRGFTYALPDRATQVVIPYDLDEIIGVLVPVN